MSYLNPLVETLCEYLPILKSKPLSAEPTTLYDDENSEERFALVFEDGLVAAFGTDGRGNVVISYRWCFEEGSLLTFSEMNDDEDLYSTFEEILIALRAADHLQGDFTFNEIWLHMSNPTPLENYAERLPEGTIALA
ncbi:MAG: hypothetical protein ABH826_03630 [Patescibacteria group bacterium]|nr:hypothetical protein [Patescibacteria group bacterium]